MRRARLLGLGFVEGLLSSTLGIGGGVIVVPTLNLGFGYDIRRAAGTSLSTIVPIAGLALLSHTVVTRHPLHLGVAAIVLLGTLLGSLLSTLLEHRLRTDALVKLFALFLAVAGINMLGIIPLPATTLQASPLILLSVGVVVGMVSNLFGVGGGILLVPSLHLLLGMPMVEAVVTSLVVIIPTALVGAILHKRSGNVDTKAVEWIIPLAVVGAVVGALLTDVLPSEILRFAFGLLVIVSAARMSLHHTTHT